MTRLEKRRVFEGMMGEYLRHSRRMRENDELRVHDYDNMDDVESREEFYDLEDEGYSPYGDDDDILSDDYADDDMDDFDVSQYELDDYSDDDDDYLMDDDTEFDF